MSKKVTFYRKLKVMPKLTNFLTFNNFKSQISILVGTFLIAASIYFIFEPTKLITGGISGLGIVVKTRTGFDVSYFTLALNLILLLLSLILLGKEYFLKTVYASIILPLFLKLFELTVNGDIFVNHLLLDTASPNISKFIQLFFATIIGSIISGVGLGMVISQNSSTGGMDIVQRILNKYLHFPFSLAIYSTDGLVVLSSVLIPLKEFDNSLPLKIVTILFSIIGVFLIGVFVDLFIFKGKKTYTFFIVSNNTKELRIKILHSLQRSFTKVIVKGGYSNDNKEMLIVTIKKQQLNQLIDIIKKYDNQAFTFVVETKDVVGYGFKNKLD